MKDQVKTQAPAKIILSGEHAVVYRKPALAFAVNRFANAILQRRNDDKIEFVLPDLHYHQQMNCDELKAQKTIIDARYKKFLAGECAIYDVIFHDYELVEYVVAYFLENSQVLPKTGFNINVTSNIPIGCGMGSSAAIIISLLHAINDFFALSLTYTQNLELGKMIEKIQHGKSSGLDICVATYGGCIYFRKGRVCAMPLPSQHNFCLVNTGRPVSATGECVEYVAPFFINDKIGEEFEQTTKSLSRALYDNNWLLFKEKIRINNKLLQEIGVVPNKVQKFIDAIEKHNGAAKISGAGSIRGENAGIVLVVDAKDYINDLVADYGYTIIPITIEEQGVRTL